MSPWSEPDVFEMFRPLILTERRSKRVNGRICKIKKITGFKKDALSMIDSLRGAAHDAATMVDDGPV